MSLHEEKYFESQQSYGPPAFLSALYQYPTFNGNLNPVNQPLDLGITVSSELIRTTHIKSTATKQDKIQIGSQCYSYREWQDNIDFIEIS